MLKPPKSGKSLKFRPFFFAFSNILPNFAGEQKTANRKEREKMFGLGMQEIIVIALIVLLLFGGKKIPELMNGLGKGVRSVLFTRVLLTILLHTSALLAICQNILTSHCNMIQAGDSLCKIKVAYTYAGNAGENVVWNFIGLRKEGIYHIKYDTLYNNRLSGYDQKKIYKYKIINDRLLVEGIETPLLKIDYHKPKLALPFPLQFNQTYSLDYEGEGRYCGTHFERTFGSIRITADAYGTLALSENDTLTNTLRVYTVNTESIRLNADSCRNDSDNLKQVITERYQWFAKGFRYPVFETVTSSTFDNLKYVATSQYSYVCPPEIQKELRDTINEKVREDALNVKNDRNYLNYQGSKNPETTERDTTNDIGFSYEIHYDGNEAIITYSIKQDSHIHVLIVDVMGMVYRDIHQHNLAGTGYTMAISCSGLKRGQYIIYININGNIYHSKIPIK